MYMPKNTKQNASTQEIKSAYISYSRTLLFLRLNKQVNKYIPKNTKAKGNKVSRKYTYTTVEHFLSKLIPWNLWDVALQLTSSLPAG